jgi:hypothetical protein
VTITINSPFPVLVIWSAIFVWGAFRVGERKAGAAPDSALGTLSGKYVWGGYLLSMGVLYLLTRGVGSIFGG